MWDNEKKFINPWRSERLGLEAIEDKRGVADLIVKLAPPILIACSELVCGPHSKQPGAFGLT